MTKPHEALRARVAEIVAGGHLGAEARRAWLHRTVVLVLDDDVDWNNPSAPLAQAETLRTIDADDIWQALAGTKPGWVNLAVYPVMPGDRVALVLAKQHPRNGPSAEPAIVIAGAAEGQTLMVGPSR